MRLGDFILSNGQPVINVGYVGDHIFMAVKFPTKKWQTSFQMVSLWEAAVRIML